MCPRVFPDNPPAKSRQIPLMKKSQMPEKYIKPAFIVGGTLMMLLGVYQLAGWWGLLTAAGATLLLFGALS